MTGAGLGLNNRRLALLTCVEALPESLTHARLGQFTDIVRNAGGVATSDAISSLVASQSISGTTAIVVLHHTDCEFLPFTVEFQTLQLSIPDRELSAGSYTDLVHSVGQALAALRASDRITHRDALHGFVYETRTKTVRNVTGPT